VPVKNTNPAETEDIAVDVTWQLSEAAVIALGHDGRVFCASDLSLSITEGRSAQFIPADRLKDDLAETWEYQFNFTESDGPEFESSEQYECRAAVIGKLADGRKIKIFGKGFVGRDSHGRIEGTFFKPPAIDFGTTEDPLLRLARDD